MLGFCFDLLSSNRNKSKKKQLKPIIKGIILNHLFATKKQIHLLNSFPIPSYMVHTRSSFDNTSRVKVTGSSRRRRRWVTLTGRVEVDEVARTELGTGRPRWSIVPAKPAIPVTATEVAWGKRRHAINIKRFTVYWDHLQGSIHPFGGVTMLIYEAPHPSSQYQFGCKPGRGSSSQSIYTVRPGSSSWCGPPPPCRPPGPPGDQRWAPQPPALAWWSDRGYRKSIYEHTDTYL